MCGSFGGRRGDGVCLGLHALGVGVEIDLVTLVVNPLQRCAPMSDCYLSEARLVLQEGEDAAARNSLRKVDLAYESVGEAKAQGDIRQSEPPRQASANPSFDPPRLALALHVLPSLRQLIVMILCPF